MIFFDEDLETLGPGTELSYMVSYAEGLAGRKLRKSEIKLFSTLLEKQYMKGREDGWMDVFSLDEQQEKIN